MSGRVFLGRTWSYGFIFFSCSTKLSTKFKLLIKTKIPTNEEDSCFKSLRCCNKMPTSVGSLKIHEQDKFRAQLSLTWNKIHNIGASTKQRIKRLAQGHNAVPPMRLEPATPRSRVKYSTAEPLRFCIKKIKYIIYMVAYNKNQQNAGIPVN